ncbi:MAG: PEP/pyruvate-binding domain-containing protein [Gemmatales bacterium]|nr:PEP-utilizing enzyme [Gemmatales bacterium]MDW7995103.1 PEP/pyruvate-binding domain-containing protein [Gemmatales bacterium]
MNQDTATAANGWLVFDTDGPQDVALVGGKGASLLELAQAGLSVPPFFVVTTRAWQAVRNTEQLAATPHSVPAALHELIAGAYERLGQGCVAVRSSAVAEDSAEASFAGQQETILGVVGLEAVLQALVRCWASAQSEQARVYRQVRGMGLTISNPCASELASGSSVHECGNTSASSDEFPMAVVVQRLIEAEVAGVLFTRDPTDPTGNHLLVEAAWGLGEGVVSGRVMPDRYRVRRDDGYLVQKEIAEKPIRVGRHGVEPVPEEMRSRPCLTEAQLAELARLARQVESYFGQPRDVEWAFAEGKLWVLQARPITTLTAWEREAYRQGEIARLRQLADPRGTVWARYNLAESLTLPTPMTWAVLRHFMSGRGGYGQLLRDLGFDPDPRLDEVGFLDLVCGRPYVNLSREPLCYFRHFPMWYPYAALRNNPSLALYPKPQLDRCRLSWRFWWHLPMTFWKMLRQAVRLNRLAEELPALLRQEVYPALRREVEAARGESFSGLSDRALWERFCYWQERTLFSFARQALRPTVVLGHLLGTLEQLLRKRVPGAEAGQLVRQLIVGVRPDPEADLAGALQRLARGLCSLESFLEQFGHRGEQELELAQPRWREVPETLLYLSRALNSSGGEVLVPDSNQFMQDWEAQWDALARRCGWTDTEAKTVRPIVERARDCAALRETSRHYLLLGYELLRQCLLELGRRWHLGKDIFYLTPEEIAPIVGACQKPLDSGSISPTAESDSQTVKKSWADWCQTIRQRRRERQLAQTWEIPAVLFSDDLECLGQLPTAPSGPTLRGIAVSPGIGEGPAWVLRTPRPETHSIPRGYVLVCPSTDPAWVPLFLNASALVMETGGILSHGAIVAREFGLPAVVGITEACQRFQTGQRLRVNGNTGEVQILAE